MKGWIFIGLVCVLLISGCVQVQEIPSPEEQAKMKCIELCKKSEKSFALEPSAKVMNKEIITLNREISICIPKHFQ